MKKLCIIPGCGQERLTRGMCRRCYSRERNRALRGVSGYFTADDFNPNRRKTIAEMAEDDLAEYDSIAPHCDPATACARIGMHPRSMVRRFQAAGRPVPAGLWKAARRGRVTAP